MTSLHRPSRSVTVALWVLAFLLTAGAAVHQRLTGPTHPRRVAFVVGDQRLKARLVRSSDTTEPARVHLPVASPDTEATLFARRYPTDEPFTEVPFVREGDTLYADLPLQPAAGKVEYRAEVLDGASRVPVPGPGEATVVLRYKDPVPAWILIPHIAFMFVAMMVGMRAALAAAFGHEGMRRLAGWSLSLMTVGGLVLGPIVQKYAFGAFWTGWPFGKDLTDNKVLVMWLAWVAAWALLALGRPRAVAARRALVVAAAVVMLVVYMIPHSLRGSELDYDKLRDGVAPKDAITTGRLPAGPGGRAPA